jgi:urease accessory protein
VTAGGATVLANLYQHSPCRVLFPRAPAGEPPLAVLVNTAGGLAGGDRACVTVTVEEGAAATVTTQAAEKIYRSLGPDAQVETRLAVGEDARLEWLPQESILFDGACLDRRISATVARGGRLLACETLVFGRAARGETMTRGRVREFWRIERGGRLAWIDRLGLCDGIAARLDGMGFGGARALATALYAGSDAGAFVPVARQVAEEEGGGATLVNGVLVARLLGASPARVRDGLARLLAALRRAAFGITSGAPALWAV